MGKLRPAFAELAKQTDKQKILVQTRVNMEKNSPSRSSLDFIDYAIRGIDVEAGYPLRHVDVGHSFQFGSLNEHIWSASKHTGAVEQPREAPIERDSVTIYPVQTLLSSYLTNSADCMAFLTAPVTNGDTDLVNAATEKEIASIVDELKPSQRNRLSISVVSQGDGRQAVARFVEQKLHDKLARRLGFKTVSISETPR